MSLENDPRENFTSPSPTYADSAGEEEEFQELEDEDELPVSTISKPRGSSIVAVTLSKQLRDGEDDFGQAELKAERKLEEEARRRDSTWGLVAEDDDAEVLGEVSQRNSLFDGGKPLSKRKKRKAQAAASKTELQKSKSGVAEDEEFVPEIYNDGDFISRPIVTPDCLIPENILHVYNSYGYDSLRPYNLHPLDEDTLLFICGNYLHFYSISKRHVTKLRRSASGYGFGHIAIHPSRKYYAVAEKGYYPLIVIYTWPEQSVYRVLRNETTRGYAFVDFSPEGDLFCSLGNEPDYLLTIWNWEKERVVLHYKAYSQDVFRVSFSLTHPGLLTTCGVGHIRFWKMAKTFTGLKLQGLIGRFGKTEISDVQGFVGLPDAKIVSTSEWGNMLVWDGGLIVVEVVPKTGKTCHDGEIMNILLLETGELLTIGLDGYFKLWESEMVGIAETIVDDSGKFEMEPIFEFRLSTDAMPISVIKRIGDEESAWFIQDGWGKAWGVSIHQAMKDNEYQPEVIFSYMGGSISSIAASVMYSLVAVANTGGHIWLIEYITKQTLAKIKYTAGVTKLMWIPRKYDHSGLHFLAAFDDGHVRLFAAQRVEKIHIDDETILTEEHSMPFKLQLTQIYRLHKASINVMLIDDKTGILYTCGDDKVIFTTKIIGAENGSVSLKPLSFVTAPFPVVSLDLHPTKDYRMVIASRQGRVAECRRPDWESRDTLLSLNKGKLHGRRWSYTSVKSHRRREERREARKKEMEEKLKALEESVMERRAQGVFVEEEIETNRIIEYYRRAQHEDDAAELYIPDKPCPVYNIYYRINKSLEEAVTSRNFFIHVGGYDAGYIYECKCTRPEPGGFHAVPPTPPFTDDVPIRCFLHTVDNQYLLFGMNDGSIRVMERANSGASPPTAALVDEDPSAPDLQIDDEDIALMNSQQDKSKKKRTVIPFPVTLFPYDIKNFLCIPMHDPNRGAVTDLTWSFDARYLFSTAQDGTIFAYRWDPAGTLTEEEVMRDNPSLPTQAILLGETLADNDDTAALTLEEQLQKAEKDRLWAQSEQKKEKMRKKIRELKSKFRYLKQKNAEIPEEFRISQDKFEIDPIIRQPMKDRLSKEVELVYRRYEWESARTLLQVEKLGKYFFDEVKTLHMVIKDISHTVQVHTFRDRILTGEFKTICNQNIQYLDEEDIKQKQELQVLKAPVMTKPAAVTRITARDLIGEYVGKKYDTKTMHQIRNLEARLLKRYERELRWAELIGQKIPDDYVDEVDERETEKARLNLGDYKLKSGDSFTGEKISLAKRRRRVIDLKNRIHETISNFNAKVFALREEKYLILADCRKLEKKLNILQRSLPTDLHKVIPRIHDIEPCEEPEKMFEISQESIKERTKQKMEALGIEGRKTAEKAAMAFGTTKSGKGGTVTGTKSPGPPPLNYKYRKLDKEASSTIKARKAFFKPTTELGKAKLEVALQFRCFEQDELLRKLNDLLHYFRNRVEAIRNERIDLQIDVLLMSLKLMTYIQELDIVKEFDSTEHAVQEKFNLQKIETSGAKDRMVRVQKRLHRVKGEFTRLELAIEEVNKEATQIIGEKSKFSDYLWKVYKKKIRSDALRNEKGDSDDEVNNGSMPKVTSTSSSGESTDSTSQDSGSDLFKLPKPKLNPNVCPDQLDKALYEKVGELRSRRTQLELEAEAQAKVVQKVERDYDEASRTYNNYTGKLEGIGEEVLALQKKKQAKINQLNALVILRADQVQCIEDKDVDEHHGTLVDRMRRNFPDLTEVVLFPKDGISKLDLRIEELKQETSDEREKHKLARNMMSRLRDEVLKVEKEVASLHDRCRMETIAKFGKTVDLDDVCAAIINLEILDELIKLENRRSWHYRERKKIADEIEKARDRLTILTKENSENNILLAILIQRQRDVEYYLWKQSKAFEGQILMLPSEISLEGSSSNFEFDDESELISNEDALEEMFNLEDILTRQECRISILRETIAACKFKVGLPPLIPLKNVKDDVASKFMTLNELYALRNRKNLMVETVYVSKDAETIGDSCSVIPTLSPPTTSEVWGVPQHATFDTAHQHDHPTYPSYAIDEVEEEEEDDKSQEREDETMITFGPPTTPSQMALENPQVSDEEDEDNAEAKEEIQVEQEDTIADEEIIITEAEEDETQPVTLLPEVEAGIEDNQESELIEEMNEELE